MLSEIARLDDALGRLTQNYAEAEAQIGNEDIARRFVRAPFSAAGSCFRHHPFHYRARMTHLRSFTANFLVPNCGRLFI